MSRPVSGQEHRRLATNVLKLCVGLGLLVWLLASVELGRLRELSGRGAPHQLWLGVAGLCAAFPILQTLRLHVLIARYTGSPAASTKLYFVGALFNNVLPSNVGGDAARLYYLRARAGELTTPLLLLLLHRVSQLGVLLLMGLAFVLASPDRVLLALDRVALRGDAFVFAGWVLAAILVLAVLVAASPLARTLRNRLDSWRRRLVVAFASVTPGMLGGLLATTLAFHAARLYGFDRLCAYFGYSVSLSELAFVLAFTALAGLLPVTVGGLGVMEGAIVASLTLFAVTPPAALGVALLNRSVLLGNALVGGVVYLSDRERMGSMRPPARDGAAP